MFTLNAFVCKGGKRRCMKLKTLTVLKNEENVCVFLVGVGCPPTHPFQKDKHDHPISTTTKKYIYTLYNRGRAPIINRFRKNYRDKKTLGGL